jgi:hypothetical protein
MANRIPQEDFIQCPPKTFNLATFYRGVTINGSTNTVTVDINVHLKALVAAKKAHINKEMAKREKDKQKGGEGTSNEVPISCPTY